jgi:outer membrane immunogenic protein
MMNRKIWIGAAAALCAASGASAADLLESTRVARQRPVLQAAAAPAALTWSGPYVGAHLGAAEADWKRDVGFLAIDCTPCRNGDTQAASFTAPERDDTAFMAGLQGGYNWQAGALVVGVEADWSLTDPRDRTAFAVPSAALVGAGLGAITTPVDGFSSAFSSDIDWLATSRGRVGLAAGNVLFYGTGGLAFAEARTRVGFLGFRPTLSDDPVPMVSRESAVRVGWTIGAGVEAALAGNVSAKLEYLYADLGRDRRLLGTYIDAPGSLLQTVTLDEKIAVHSVKLGLNYRFAGP